MIGCSRLQLRLAISAQSRNWRSLERHSLTSVNRLASQPTAIALADSPGLALMKASSTACGVTLSGSLRSVNSGGIFTAARAFAHGLEINARRLAGTGAVAIPFIENQPRRRHQIEHGGDHAAVKPRRWNLAVFWKAVVVLRPQPMHDEGIGSRNALHIAGHGVGAPLGSASAEGWQRKKRRTQVRQTQRGV